MWGSSVGWSSGVGEVGDSSGWGTEDWKWLSAIPSVSVLRAHSPLISVWRLLSYRYRLFVDQAVPVDYRSV